MPMVCSLGQESISSLCWVIISNLVVEKPSKSLQFYTSQFGV